MRLGAFFLRSLQNFGEECAGIPEKVVTLQAESMRKATGRRPTVGNDCSRSAIQVNLMALA